LQIDFGTTLQVSFCKLDHSGVDSGVKVVSAML